MITAGYYTSQLENIQRKLNSPQKIAQQKHNQIKRNWMLSNCDRLLNYPLQPQKCVLRSA